MSGPKKLIVNADGFGFGPGATQGIIDAIREGKFISSVSVNANFPDVERVRELITEFPQISIGIHLNAMAGKPCLAAERVPSLVGPDGYFQGDKFLKLLHKRAISPVELEAEFDAQFTRIKDLAGSHVTHIDSQGNSHLDYFHLFLKLARKWGLNRIRNNASLICLESLHPRLSRLCAYLWNPHVWLMHRYRALQMYKARATGIRLADKLVTVGYARTGNKTNFHNWLRILKNLPAGTYEIYCHPAYPDETLRHWSYYCDERARELEILRKRELCEIARTSGVHILSFHEI